MHQSNKMCYAEYERKLENRLEVEKRRDKEYQQSKKITAEYSTQ
ncbi:hypothetical protein [Lentibacillus sediminis]|nr:hypothetical protein [Lentibacillus sediminis]